MNENNKDMDTVKDVLLSDVSNNKPRRIIRSEDISKMKEVEAHEILPEPEVDEEEVSLILPKEEDFQNVLKRIDKEKKEFYEKRENQLYMEKLEKELAEDANEDVDDLDEEDLKAFDLVENVEVDKSFNFGSMTSDEPVEEVIIEEVVDNTAEAKDLTNIEDEEVAVNTLEFKSEDELEEEEIIEEEPVEPLVSITKESVINLKDANEDESTDLDDIEVEEKDEQEEFLERLTKEAKVKIKPIHNVVDISKFKISKSVKKTPNVVFKKSINRNFFNWAYVDGKKPLSMKEMSSKDLVVTMEGLRNFRSLDNASVVNLLNLMYEHIISPKPQTMSEWAKTVSYIDLENLIFAIYGAAFSKSNYMYYYCDKGDGGCSNVWISDNVTMDMLYEAIDDDKLHELINTTLNSTMKNKIDVELIQVSDTVVVGVKSPSLWDLMYEPTLLTKKDHETYSNYINYMMFVDSVYNINMDTYELEEVIMDPTGDTSTSRVVRQKYKILFDFFESLTTDQFQSFMDYVNKFSDKKPEVKFFKPETYCPKCNKKIEREEMDVLDLLFLRVQLGAMKNS